MEQPEVKELLRPAPATADPAVPAASTARPATSLLAPQACATCGAAPAANAKAVAAAPFFARSFSSLCGNPRSLRISIRGVSFHRPWFFLSFLLLFSFWAFSTRKFCARIA